MRLGSLKRAWVYYRVNHIYAGTRCFEKKRRLLNSVGHSLGEGTKIVGPLFCTGRLVVGENCWIGRGLTIHGNGTVTMGSNCDIGPDVTFLTGSHELGDATRRAGKGKTFDVTVGNGVWVGARSTVMADVGDGSAIAACACVSKAVGENVLVGGVPAKTIREL